MYTLVRRTCTHWQSVHDFDLPVISMRTWHAYAYITFICLYLGVHGLDLLVVAGLNGPPLDLESRRDQP